MAIVQNTQPQGNTDWLGKLLNAIGVFANILAFSTFIATWFDWDSNIILGGLLIMSLFASAVVYRFTRRINWRFTIGILLLAMVLVFIAWTFLSSLPMNQVQVDITNPTNGAEITGFQSVVQGHVDNTYAQVRVIVHPLAVAEAWVQDAPIIDAAGNWQINAYFGEPGNGINQDYEVIVIATRENFLVNLATGNNLSKGKIDIRSLPQNANRSQRITVTRTR